MAEEKKGQVNLYFLISVALFISLSVYLVFLLINFYPEKGETIRINSLYSKAYTISELMLKDPGYPEEWNENTVQRLGLTYKPYELNSTKVDQLGILCNPMSPSLRNRLYNSTGLSNEYLIITIRYLNGTSVLECSPSGEAELNMENSKRRTALVSRIATYNGEMVMVNVYVG